MLCGSESSWYCIRTRHQQETTAESELKNQGFVVWFGRYVSVKSGRELPLFPRYGFVRFCRDVDNWRPIVSTRGVAFIFSASAEDPLPLRPGVVEDLMTRFGEHRIAVGDKVRALKGAMAGQIGICTLSVQDRLSVLHSLLGSQFTVDYSRNDLVPA